MKKKVIFVCSILILVLLVALFFMFRNSNGNQAGIEDRSGSNFPVFKNYFKDKVENEDYTESNAKILAQLKDEEFWNGKIEEIIENNFKNEWSSVKWDINILWYWLLCEQWNENLSDCTYRVWFTNLVKNSHNNSFYSWFSYEVYSNNGSSSSRKKFSYHVAAKEIAMNDIWNWGVFYNYSDWKQASSLIKKYLWEDFETKYGLDDNSIKLVRLLTNNDNWTINYHVYIVNDEWWNIVYNVSNVMIDEETAKKIISNDAWVGINHVDYSYLDAEKWIYRSKFSYSWITYNYEINAKDGTIIEGKNMVDIGEDKALEIAMLDAWIVWEDLWEDVDHWLMQYFLEPSITKIWSWKSATYQIEIKVNNEIVYYYKILSVNWRIISKQISKDFTIDWKKWSGSWLVYIIKSISNLNEKYDMKLSDVNMDDIYKFKDKIILRVTFEDNKIISYILRDKYSRLYLKQKTSEELEELYNFESHYKMKDMGVFPWDTINLSELRENIIYKYTLPKWNYSYIELVNDLWEDAIVYKGRERTDIENPTIKYGATPYLKDWYKEDYTCKKWPCARVNADDEILYVLYKKASTEDLLKIINKGEITYLSKYNAWDKITAKDRSYNENYLYNDTDNSLTVLITRYIWSEDEPIEVTVKPWKIVHCSENVGSITILN